MSTNLPATTGGGAVVSLPAGDVIPAGHVGDLSRDSGGPGNTAPVADSSPEILRLRREMFRDMIINGIGEHEIERCLPIFKDYAPPLRAALNTSNRQELARLAYGLRDEIVRKGLLTLEQTERIRPILQRYSQENERALLGPGAGNTELIDEMRELDSLMAQRDSRYWTGPDADRLQRRWRELHDLGVRADGKRSTPDKDVGSRGGSSRDLSSRELRALSRRCFEIEGWMNSGDARYWKDEGVQAEYRSIIDEGETADATPSTAEADVERRIGEIVALVGARVGSADYKRYWNDPGIQREYVELLERRKHAQHRR
jgi:hypothetical protein